MLNKPVNSVNSGQQQQLCKLCQQRHLRQLVTALSKASTLTTPSTLSTATTLSTLPTATTPSTASILSTLILYHLRTRSIGWALFGVNFRSLQEIEAIMGGWADIWYWALFCETTVYDTYKHYPIHFANMDGFVYSRLMVTPQIRFPNLWPTNGCTDH